MGNFIKKSYKECVPLYYTRINHKKGRKPLFKCDECKCKFYYKSKEIMMLKPEVSFDGNPWFLCYDCFDLDKGWNYLSYSINDILF